MYLSDLRVYFPVEVYFRVTWSLKWQKKLVDYANTTNVEFIVGPKVLFRGWLIYRYLQIFKLIKSKWLPGECADWFFDNIMIWSYYSHRRYSMSRQKNRILINEHALNPEPVPLKLHQIAQIIQYLKTSIKTQSKPSGGDVPWFNTY